MGRIQQKSPSLCDKAEVLNGGEKAAHPLQLSYSCCFCCFCCKPAPAWCFLYLTCLPVEPVSASFHPCWDDYQNLPPAVTSGYHTNWGDSERMRFFFKVLWTDHGRPRWEPRRPLWAWAPCLQCHHVVLLNSAFLLAAYCDFFSDLWKETKECYPCLSF